MSASAWDAIPRDTPSSIQNDAPRARERRYADSSVSSQSAVSVAITRAVVLSAGSRGRTRSWIPRAALLTGATTFMWTSRK